jgi:hypothetical protein
VTGLDTTTTGAVGELTGALNLMLGGFLPKLPEQTKAPTC